MNGFRADLHIHSPYAMATSKYLNPASIAEWGDIKGIDVIGTGDFTHPTWLQILKETLEIDTVSNFYRLKESHTRCLFALTSEVSLIYYDKEKARKIHMLLIAPDVATVEAINKVITQYGNLEADGRPILLISCEEFTKEITAISNDIEIIPAHIWTPWFGVVGSRFGYDNLESCFKSQRDKIHAIETGLSSDPAMNWDIFPETTTILSFSDAHSLQRIGRETTIFADTATYSHLISGIRKNKVIYTIEFFPEEGKYHYSGHRKCSVCLTPEEETAYGSKCPVCKRKLTEGVVKRISDIAGKPIDTIMPTDPSGFISKEGRKPFVKLIPLTEIISSYLHIKSTASKKVQLVYIDMTTQFGNELDILLNPSEEFQETYPGIYRNIHRILTGDISIIPGYDNTYGRIEL